MAKTSLLLKGFISAKVLVEDILCEPAGQDEDAEEDRQVLALTSQSAILAQTVLLVSHRSQGLLLFLHLRDLLRSLRLDGHLSCPGPFAEAPHLE